MRVGFGWDPVLKPMDLEEIEAAAGAPALLAVADRDALMHDLSASRCSLANSGGVTADRSPAGPVLKLNGTNGYVQTQLTPGTWPALTVAVSVRLDAAASYPMAVSYGTNSDPPGGATSIPELRCNAATGQMQWIVRATNAGVTDSVSIVGTGWHRFVGVAIFGTGSAGLLALYKDGVLLGTTALAVGIQGSMPFRIGARGDSTSFPWSGAIDNCHVYPRALSSAEVLLDAVDPWRWQRRGGAPWGGAFIRAASGPLSFAAAYALMSRPEPSAGLAKLLSGLPSVATARVRGTVPDPSAGIASPQ